MRIVNMRGVDLNVFKFDYDLPWAAFFMNADEQIYGRFGGRDPDDPDRYLTIPALKHALRSALKGHAACRVGGVFGIHRLKQPAAANSTPRTRTNDHVSIDQLPPARRLSSNACIHCHHVYDFRREHQIAIHHWNRADVWVYPPPANLGLHVDPNQGNRIEKIAPASPAEAAGLEPGDLLIELNGVQVASFADCQQALHIAPESGSIAVSWRRAASMAARINLPPGWRESDISWRASMWKLEPAPGVQGLDLSADEKAELGLKPNQLAFRQSKIVTPAARTAGVQPGDVIIGVAGQHLEMTARQFQAYIRTRFSVGDEIQFDILRYGKPIRIRMSLAPLRK